LPSRIGLYYPFIHFRDDSWVKLAALYWGKLARIVPRDYPTRDSDVVRELDYELDLIVNRAPDSASNAVGRDFAQVITAQSGELRERYAVRATQLGWGHQKPMDPVSPRAEDEDVAWIHITKLDLDLRCALVDGGLAVNARGQDWIGVHPTVAEVYMTALADEMAARRGYEPVTSEPLHHVAASWSVRRIAAALLGEPHELESPASQPQVALAFLAIQTLIPQDLAAVPARRIVEVRRKYEAELATFQDAIGSIVDGAALKDIRDADALREHLQLTYNERIKPQLETLQRDLKLLKLDTAVSAVDMKVAAPGLIVGSMGAAGIDASEPVMAGSGVAFGVTSLLLNQRSQGLERYRSSPAAYLLRCEEGLTPASLSKRVQRGVRQFIRGV
jgi:hypothetical protein